MSNDDAEILQPEDAPVILAIETATRAGSVAVLRGEQVLASTRGDASASHSTDLIENIDEVLRTAGLQLQDVDLFAAANGPGSFTGLRIGLATVKSLAVALNRKCAGVSTLAAIAYAAGDSERTVALLPAGRGEVFAQMFSVRDGNVTAFDEAMHISPKMLLTKYGDYSTVKWAGEGAYAQLETLSAAAEQHGIAFVVGDNRQMSGWSVAAENHRIAEAVGVLALRDYRANRILQADQLRANYVRPSDAEMKVHA
jgi:tRNA threonylcarbamoyladenosine biosynthesis protein TsaB